MEIWNAARCDSDSHWFSRLYGQRQSSTRSSLHVMRRTEWRLFTEQFARFSQQLMGPCVDLFLMEAWRSTSRRIEQERLPDSLLLDRGWKFAGPLTWDVPGI